MDQIERKGNSTFPCFHEPSESGWSFGLTIKNKDILQVDGCHASFKFYFLFKTLMTLL